MTRFFHDEFAKGFLESLLAPFGEVQTSFKISSEVREVDVYFQPDRSIQLIPELGLLGQIARTNFVLEPFRNPPTIFQIRACMGKLFDLHANLIREAKRTDRSEPNNADLPMLWILAPTLSKPILAEYAATLMTEFSPTGVYLFSPGCKTGIIVIHQLPKTPETVWFRLLGKERVQANAIAEVAALPQDHPCRQDTLSWLGNLKVILEAREVREPEEEDLMMQLSPLFLEKLQAAESIGEVKGRENEAQALILRQLNRRVGKISIDLEAQIKTLPLAQLEELGDALLDFSQMSDLVAWLDVNNNVKNLNY
jgi:Domain of unknown function (DUF4351)